MSCIWLLPSGPGGEAGSQKPEWETGTEAQGKNTNEHDTFRDGFVVRGHDGISDVRYQRHNYES